MIADKFGLTSLEYILAHNAAGDGDLWGRLSRNLASRKAINNIMEEFLWVDQ